MLPDYLAPLLPRAELFEKLKSRSQQLQGVEVADDSPAYTTTAAKATTMDVPTLPEMKAIAEQFQSLENPGPDVLLMTNRTWEQVKQAFPPQLDRPAQPWGWTPMLRYPIDGVPVETCSTLLQVRVRALFLSSEGKRPMIVLGDGESLPPAEETWSTQFPRGMLGVLHAGM